MVRRALSLVEVLAHHSLEPMLFLLKRQGANQSLFYVVPRLMSQTAATRDEFCFAKFAGVVEWLTRRSHPAYTRLYTIYGGTPPCVVWASGLGGENRQLINQYRRSDGMAYMTVSKTVERKLVRVQLPPSAPFCFAVLLSRTASQK